MEAVRTHRWTRREVERMAEAGVLHPEKRLELINGELVETSPQSSRHATAIRKVEEALRSTFDKGFDVRVQLPLSLSEIDQPEPDVAVVRGHFDDYAEAHPSEAVLVVEAADTSLDFDRGPKLEAYARGGVPEYWIVNLPEACVEVYREPFGETYRSKTTFEGETPLAPAAASEATLAAQDLLP